jgi:hypothetical protein
MTGSDETPDSVFDFLRQIFSLVYGTSFSNRGEAYQSG